MGTPLFLTTVFLTTLTALCQANSVLALRPNQTSNHHWLYAQEGVKSVSLETPVTQSSNGSCKVSRIFPCACFLHAGSLKHPTVDCSRRNLSYIPSDIPGDAIELNLSHNRLGELSSGGFRTLTQLEKLDLSNNDIVYFGSGIFLELNHLKKLLLNDNPFNLSPAAFADDVFAPLTNLTYLNLKTRVGPEDRKGEYPDVALGQLPSLDTLLITGLSSTNFGAGVKNMTSLETLDFTGSPYFTSLSKDLFQHFKNIPIRLLNLSFCDLRWIDREAFLNLLFIETIDYSFNQKLNIKGVSNSSFGLQNSTIRNVTLQRVHAKDIIAINLEDVQYLQNTALEKLYIYNNTIGSIDAGVIDALPRSLKVIDISWNRIQINYAQLLELFRLQNLEEVYAGYQQNFLSQDPGLELQTAVHWNDVKEPAVKPDEMKVRRVETTSELEYFNISIPPKLWLFDSSYSFKLKFTVPYFRVINSSIKVVKLSYNLLRQWVGPVLGVESLLYLDLSGNSCEFVSPYFFGYATALKSLLIGNNRLGPQLHELTFHNLSSLRHLDMESNRLEDVGPNLFSSLLNLTRLNLSGNYLSDWNANISGLRKMAVLDLSNNMLSSLPERLLRDLDSIQESRPVRLDIHGNWFKCICQTKDFVHWFTGTKVQFKTLKSTFCTLANGTRISLTKNKVIWEYLDSSCRSYAALIGVLSAALAVILFTICGAAVHRYRWKLRYLYYMAANRGKRTSYQRLESTEHGHFDFDAFVSYEESDLAFITEHIIPRLEYEAGLKLCIDKRDFIPGLYITDNIMNAIQKSRKTVVLLSRKFLKSRWCMYELNMARMEGIYNDRQLLIAVILEEIPTAILVAEVLEIIQDQTYIERAENKYGKALFWERLIGALKSES